MNDQALAQLIQTNAPELARQVVRELTPGLAPTPNSSIIPALSPENMQGVFLMLARYLSTNDLVGLKQTMVKLSQRLLAAGDSLERITATGDTIYATLHALIEHKLAGEEHSAIRQRFHRRVEAIKTVTHT